MSAGNIESNDDYADYTIISKESFKLLDEMQIEWRGRNVLEVYDDVRIKAILMAAREYTRCSQNNPPQELARIKSEAIEFIADVFSTVETDPNQEESHLDSRFDPISGAHIVLPVACSHWKKLGDKYKAVARNLEHALHARDFKSYRLSDSFAAVKV